MGYKSTTADHLHHHLHYRLDQQRLRQTTPLDNQSAISISKWYFRATKKQHLLKRSLQVVMTVSLQRIMLKPRRARSVASPCQRQLYPQFKFRTHNQTPSNAPTKLLSHIKYA